MALVVELTDSDEGSARVEPCAHGARQLGPPLDIGSRDDTAVARVGRSALGEAQHGQGTRRGLG